MTDGVQEDRALLSSVEASRNELARRHREEAIRYYRPHPKQARYHAAGSKYRLRFICGGNRSGKSQAEMAEAVAHMEGFRRWLPKDHPDYWVIHPMTGKRLKVPNRGLIVGESFNEQVKKVLLHKLLGPNGRGGLIPAALLKPGCTRKNQQGVISEIHLTNGSSVYFKSYDQEVRLFESEDYDWYALDEPPPREHYVAIARGATDTGAPIFCAMTPLREAWINDDIISRDDVYSDVWDTTDNIGFGLTEKKVAELRKDLTEDEVETRLHGRFFHLQGVIYKEWNRERHLIRRPTKKWPVDGRWQYFMHLDPHVRKPHRCVWVALRPDGVYLVIGALENPPGDNLISTTKEMILSYERSVLELPHHEVFRLIDPLATVEGLTTGEGISLYDELQSGRHPLYFTPGSKKRETAIHYMHELLRARPEEGLFPRLYVVEDLSRVIYEFEHYQFEEYSRETRERKDPNPAPRKRHDDYLEGIHRIVLHTYVPDDVTEDDYEPPVAVSGGFRRGY